MYRIKNNSVVIKYYLCYNGFFMEESLQKFIDYLEKEKQYSEHTILAYKNDIETYLKFLTKKNKEYQSVKYQTVRLWIVTLMDQNLAKRSINRKISSIKAFYKFLMKIEEVDSSPLQHHKTLKIEKKAQLPFSVAEIDQVRKELENASDYDSHLYLVIVEMLYCLGLRRSELCNIQLSDVDFYTKTVKIHGKGNKIRYVPIIDNLEKTLKSYLVERELYCINNEKFNYFLIDKEGRKVDEIFVYRVINFYFSKTTTKEKNSPHMLRHAFATHLLENGADINSIKELMGHKSLASTEGYAHVNLKELKQAYMKAHPRLKKKN